MKTLTGTTRLIRLVLRRDRLILSLWIILLGILALGFASSFSRLYPTPALQQAYANEIRKSPAEIALLGPVFAPTIGGLVAWRWSMAEAILIGLASLLTVIRHTRADEEKGRHELLGATAVGRQAALTATLSVTFCADLAIGLLTAVTLSATGLPIAGSLALGLSATAVGWVFAALAGALTQLTQNAGTARGLAGTALGLFYLLRIVGDAAGESGLGWLSWLSPLGWMRAIQPFAFTGEQWWIFALFLVLVAALLTTAYTISVRRDLGAGLLATRPGPAVASPWLNGPLALVWRLQRTTILAWTAGFLVIGAVFGSVAELAASQFPTGSPLIQALGGKENLSNGFFTLALLMFIEVIAFFTIQTALRLRASEREDLADPILATPISRLRWAGSYLVMIAGGPALVLAAFGLSAGLTYGLSGGNVAFELPRILVAALAYVPAIWALAGLTVALSGLFPRSAVFLSWTALVVCVAIDLGGELQLINPTIQSISPFYHVPKLLLNQGTAWPLTWLVILAALLTAAGLTGFQRRDIG